MSHDSHNKRILNDNKCDMKDNKTVIETGHNGLTEDPLLMQCQLSLAAKKGWGGCNNKNNR